MNIQGVYGESESDILHRIYTSFMNRQNRKILFYVKDSKQNDVYVYPMYADTSSYQIIFGFTQHSTISYTVPHVYTESEVKRGIESAIALVNSDPFKI